MSIGQIIVLTAVVGAFVVFAVVLAWGDYRAQQVGRRIRERDREQTAPAPSAVKPAPAPAPKPARWPQESDDRLQHVA